MLRRSEHKAVELQFPLFQGNSLYYLGCAHFAKEEWTEAISCLNKALQIMLRDGRNDLLCKVRLLLLECEWAQGKISVSKLTKQLKEWLSQYSLRTDQTRIHFALWKWSDMKDLRKEAERLIMRAYEAMPIPYYQELLFAMKLVPGATLMEPPPLPEEAAAVVKATEFLDWIEEQEVVYYDEKVSRKKPHSFRGH